ncbi:MAG: helix-turn-helix transcriptional regulator [Clostridia bacterium]|nr:helix-turn-helix transcriptional regulator [Clostridia bacterium]
MEFNEKLQQLRKSRGLTQEELAEALFVSRTAVSKWESGRGYPNIDSLKELSRFFSVKIDDLICSEEIISAAENEKKEFIGKYLSFLCGALDAFLGILLFIPVFGNGAGASAVSLFGLTGVNPWIKAVFAVLLCLTVLQGICAIIISRLDKPAWSRYGITAGLVLSIIASAVFLLTRQPYPGLICFAALVIKGFLLLKAK